MRTAVKHYPPRLFIILFAFFSISLSAQEISTGDTVLAAGPQYRKSGLHEFLWGTHYRQDWYTPVRHRVIHLDTLFGGLHPYQAGGGRQSRTLRMHDARKREYVMRSIDKTFGGALPEIYRGTFIEKIINDQVSIAEPYAAVTIPPMADAAGIYHTNPIIGYVPRQSALDSFSTAYGDQLYLVEQRPDENWEDAPNFGSAKNIVGTERLLEKLREDNEAQIDQRLFIRSRLFDMFIGDWGRHEDQWRWAEFKEKENDRVLYKPIPRDRDQAYTKFDGLLLRFALSAAAGHLEGLDDEINDVDFYNYPARHLDRRATNEMLRADWEKEARHLQEVLTDPVIEDAMRRLPPEVYANYGPWIAEKLKARRQQLVSNASEYYTFLAKEVDIPGSEKAEVFELSAENGATRVRVYDLDKQGQKKPRPFYDRLFDGKETKEIRLYGLAGSDQYEGSAAHKGPRVRLIGGTGTDDFRVDGRNADIKVYDNAENNFGEAKGLKKKLSHHDSVHHYDYAAFEYDDAGLGPVISYNSDDRIHFGLKYKREKKGWRKNPFAYRQTLAARYSQTENGFSYGYEGIFKQVLGRWDLLINGTYDEVFWRNFYGIGNETVMGTEDRDYHRVRTREALGSVALEKLFGTTHTVRISGLYQNVRLKNDPGRLHTQFPFKGMHFTPDEFAGGRIDYTYRQLDRLILPRKGFVMRAAGQYLQNLDVDSATTTLMAETALFLPLSPSFVFHMRTGAQTVFGEPEFYQLSQLGGARSLRGVRSRRFYGKTMAYNQAEIQFIRPVRSFLMNGQAGLIGLYDIGRVWQPGENSNKFHHGYGGGFVLAPFNRISVAVFYAVLGDENAFALRFNTGL